MDKRIIMKKHQFTSLLLVVFFFNTINLFAEPVFDDDVVDVPTAPIDIYKPMLLLAAVIIAYRILRKKLVKKTKLST